MCNYSVLEGWGICRFNLPISRNTHLPALKPLPQLLVALVAHKFFILQLWSICKPRQPFTLDVELPNGEDQEQYLQKDIMLVFRFPTDLRASLPSNIQALAMTQYNMLVSLRIQVVVCIS